ncbi:Homoserine/homoserine lactone efflux protein [Candidatus Rhodobacter oscarellae]|uniref:Homoserine/homoserine lactone efflux protein n=1 Tax=Candidatus Rhodobacter oscarellae TaxID=1675527 RepID=A0A0J9E0C3_9RHOB|nr:LysE family translocator [Candidatus Rhodobacter lobularis]KMW56102.1 Homoserine/homoserine lactone efflux protein [Candidatus Rhodobacter lobularis]
MDFTIWMAFVAATLVLLAIPGPTVLLVLSYAIGHGRRVAVSTALGVGLGDFIAMTASLVGLGAIVLASATLFTVLKWAGAAYLIYLGVKLWRSAGQASLALTPDAASQSGIFWHACLVTALNPKSIAFFIAFVPQFLDPAANLLPQFAILIGTFVGLAAANALIYALLAARMRDFIGRPRVIAWLTRLGGGVLVAMGVATATLRRA